MEAKAEEEKGASDKIKKWGQIFNYYKSLPQPDGAVLATYIWLGNQRTDIHCKTRTLALHQVEKLEDIPFWEFDGSITGQSYGADADVNLKPVRVAPDPFHGPPNVLVLCECTMGRKAIPTNTRFPASKVFAQVARHRPLFAFVQQYGLFHPKGTWPYGLPLGWPKAGFPKQQMEDCTFSVGTMNRKGTLLAESHYRACLCAGLRICALQSGKFKGEWCFKLGSADGIRLCDELILARWILLRVAEDFGVGVSFDPKPYPDSTHTRRCAVQFSIATMRDPSTPNGFKRIVRAVEKLGRAHHEHVAVYGNSNMNRPLKRREAIAAIPKFSYGVANAFASVNIPRSAKVHNCGYLEDRRPSSNSDPYVVAAKIAKTILLEEC